MEKQQIVDFVLSPAPKRFELAMAICESYEAIKKKVICDFAANLRERLEEFPGYSFDSTVQKYPENYILICINKSSWNDVSIGLQAQRAYARNFVIGIYKGKALRDDCPDLYNNLSNKYGLGRKDPWWYYYRPLDRDRYINWDYEVLFALHDGNALEYFVGEFARLARIAEPILDKGIAVQELGPVP